MQGGSKPSAKPAAAAADEVPPEVAEALRDVEDDAPPAEEDLGTSTEHVVGEAESHIFQAETKQLLDIVAHSLYTDTEVFIRELISNASDALEKARYELVTGGGEGLGSNLHIQVFADPAKNTITIQDTGVGMTKEELVENLGTIAHSGSKAFLNVCRPPPAPCRACCYSAAWIVSVASDCFPAH